MAVTSVLDCYLFMHSAQVFPCLRVAFVPTNAHLLRVKRFKGSVDDLPYAANANHGLLEVIVAGDALRRVEHSLTEVKTTTSIQGGG